MSTESAVTSGDPAHEHAPPRSFGEAITTCLSKYATFEGRASRSEYWYFVLFTVLLSFATALISDVLNLFALLAIALPSLAVGVRRLHDTDRSGWWYLIWFVPVVGWVILIVFFCQRGTPGRNQFG